MLKFILRRLLNYLLLLVVAVTLAYFIAGTQLDPRSMLIEAEITSGKNIPYEEVVRTVDQRLTGWNINPTDPILDRFFNWVGMISHWDWGHSHSEIASMLKSQIECRFLSSSFSLASLLELLVAFPLVHGLQFTSTPSVIASSRSLQW